MVPIFWFSILALSDLAVWQRALSFMKIQSSERGNSFEADGRRLFSKVAQCMTWFIQLAFLSLSLMKGFFRAPCEFRLDSRRWFRIILAEQVALIYSAQKAFTGEVYILSHDGVVCHIPMDSRGS